MLIVKEQTLANSLFATYPEKVIVARSRLILLVKRPRPMPAIRPPRLLRGEAIAASFLLRADPVLRA